MLPELSGRAFGPPAISVVLIHHSPPRDRLLDSQDESTETPYDYQDRHENRENLEQSDRLFP
jgi:hypothetical protein